MTVAAADHLVATLYDEDNTVLHRLADSENPRYYHGAGGHDPSSMNGSKKTSQNSPVSTATPRCITE